MTRPADDHAAGRQDQPPLAGDSPASSNSAARPDSPEGGAPSGRSQAGVSPPGDSGHFSSLLCSEAPAALGAGRQDQDRSFARDLNLDQIVAVVAGDREEGDLITRVLYTRLRDAGAVRYRQEVFQDLEDPALFDEVQRFAGLMQEVRAHLRQLAKMQYRYQREGWLLDAAAIYCDAVQSLAGHLASAQISSRGLLAFRKYLACYAASAGFIALVTDTRHRKDALGHIRYCTRIRGGRVEVSRDQDEADYSAMVLKTFERFKQGAVNDYQVRYRTRPGMNHVAAQIQELVARLFPEEFTALEEYPGGPRARLRRDRPQPGRQDHLCPDLRPAPPPGRRRLPGPGQRRPPVPVRPALHPFRAGGGPGRDEREAGG